MARRALVYGGSGGIGFATAKRLADLGFELHLVGRDADKLTTCAQELGARCTAGDVKDPLVFARVQAEGFDSLDALVYAVGTIQLKSLARLTPEEFLSDFQVNALGAALAVQASLSALKRAEGGASVVLFSSVAASQGFSLHASIGMAKAAVNGLVVALAAELAPKIRVNAIAPSITRTPLAAKLLASPTVADALAASHPLKRVGTAEDIAALATFLASDQSSWMTGQVVALDGGRSSVRNPS